MNDRKILTLIEEVYINMSHYYVKYPNSIESDRIFLEKTAIVLGLLKSEIENNPDKINIRVLRGVSDLGMYAYKVFEATSLENAIVNLSEALSSEIPSFLNIKPLGLHFGKGDPI